MKSISLRKVCGPRRQAWPRFCLILKQVAQNINHGIWSEDPSMTKVLFNVQTIIKITYNVRKKNMAKLPFINNSTFTSYLHSKVVVQIFRLDLLGSMLLCLLPRWYFMVLPNWALTSPMLGFFTVPSTFLTTKSPGANGLNFTFESYLCLSFCW